MPISKTTQAILKAFRSLIGEDGPNNLGRQSSQAGNLTALRTPSLKITRRGRVDPSRIVRLGSKTEIIINPTMKQCSNRISSDDVNVGDKAFKRSEKVTEAMSRYLQALDKTVPMNEKNSKLDTLQCGLM